MLVYHLMRSILFITIVAFAIAVVLLASFVSTAYASDHIRILKCDGAKNWKECASIAISGEIALEDGLAFFERTKEIKKATVTLSSLGGNFLAGLAIGERIFEKKFHTFVPKDQMCASSCAHIWLAGDVKKADIGSVISFHPPYDPGDPTHADGTASVALGIYLSKIGYSYKNAAALFGHGPLNSKAYVVRPDGNQVGVSCDVNANGVEECKP